MKLVAISSLGVDHEYVLRSLHRQFPLQAIIRPIARRHRVRRTLSEKFRKFAMKPVESVSERFNSWYFELAERRFDSWLAAELRGDQVWNWDVPVHCIPRDELHS